MRPALPARVLPVALLGLLALPAGDAAAARKQPELGRQFVVALVSGEVFVKPRGARRASRLSGRRTIPVGSRVDAIKGRVRLVGAQTRRRRAKGVFSDGAFIATQARRKRAIIDLELTGGGFGGCDGARPSQRRRIARRLRGKARGRFRTRGRHSAATVRGTKWVTEDRCETTAITTEAGQVDATVASTALEVLPGQVFEARCDPPLNTGVAPSYCVATLNTPAEGIFAVGFGTRIHYGDYTLCIFGPNGVYRCRGLPLPEPEPGADFRISVLGCAPEDGPGTYGVGWYWQDLLVDSLYVPVTVSFPPGTGLCPVTFEDLGAGVSRRSPTSSGRVARIPAHPPGASAPSATPRRG